MKKTNESLTRRFNEVYACAHSNLRVNLLERGGIKRFIERSEGSRLWDVEGKEYIDYMGAYGPNILGHCHPDYVESLTRYLSKRSPALGSGALFTAEDVALGEKLVKHIPCAEKIKICISGTDAVLTATRLARAYTGRPRFIRFEGGYHGWGDAWLGGVMNPEPNGRPFGLEGIAEDLFFTHGKAPLSVEQSFLLPYNDIEALEETLRKYGEEVALIHLEPIVCNHCCMMPKPGFFERVRELCDRYGIVMSFDEVITGFRLALGGAQEYLGFTPDMATYGKAMANGVPISAVAGKAEIMERFTDGTVLSPGTFNGYPFGICAALTTLEILEREDGAIYKHIDRVTNRLIDGLREIVKRRGLPIRVQGATGVVCTTFGADPDAVIYTERDLKNADMFKGVEFYHALLDAGVAIFLTGRWHVSAAISESDVDETLEISDKVLGARS